MKKYVRSYNSLERDVLIMTVISPVSDLRNYNTVLDKVKYGSPVYLTVNGRGKYTIRDIEEDEEIKKQKRCSVCMVSSRSFSPKTQWNILYPTITSLDI